MERKARIRRAFDGAASGYEAAARPQAMVAAMLADRLPPLPPAARILEVGCGTGLFTRLLPGRLGPAGRVLATDLSPAMLAHATLSLPDPRLTFQVMDAEYPVAGLGGFDLVVSSLAAQWFSDLEGALQRLSALLVPGGRLLLASLGAQSFAQWRTVHGGLGLADGMPTYPDAGELAALLPGARVEEARLEMTYDDARAFLNSLDDMGAATPRPGHRPLGPGAMRRVLSRAGAPFVATWHILFLEFRA